MPFLLIFLASFCSLTALAVPDYRSAIYGDDDRINIYETKDEALKQLAQASAAVVRNSALEPIEADTYLLHGRNPNFCRNEKFAEERAFFTCSAVLVGKRTMLTAGHCLYPSDCERTKFIFGMERATEAPVRNPIVVRAPQMYACAKVIVSHAEGGRGSDFALVELDRDVVGVRPAQVAKNFKVETNAPLVMIGYPLGLVKKIAPGVARRESADDNTWLETNLDAFGGNSGSPVYNQSHELLGILVRGMPALDQDPLACQTLRRCSENGCNGEFVYKLKDVAALIEANQ